MMLSCEQKGRWSFFSGKFVRLFVFYPLLAILALLTVDPLVSQVHAQDASTPEISAPADGGDKSSKSFIAHAFESAGVGWSLLMGVISISMVALSVFLLMELRLSAATPAELVEEFSKQVNARQFSQAQTLLAENPSLLARALSAGLPKLQYGLDEASEAMSRKVEEFRAGKELIISFMAVIAMSKTVSI